MTSNFTFGEFVKSNTAEKRGIDNTPNQEHLENLQKLACVLEQVREVLNNSPIIITSAYRSPKLNEAVGGVPNSDHAIGLACDFVSPKFGSVYEVCKAIEESDIKFDQLIYEQGKNSDWVHFGIGERMRQEVLSWKHGYGYVVGIKKL